MAGRLFVQDVRAWAEWGRLGEQIGKRFKRSKPRRRAREYLRWLRGDAQRKNGWQMAEQMGEATPDGVPHLLARADRDAEAGRDDLSACVADNLRHADGVLVADETGFVKKGKKTVGVARPEDAGRAGPGVVGVARGAPAAGTRVPLPQTRGTPTQLISTTVGLRLETNGSGLWELTFSPRCVGREALSSCRSHGRQAEPAKAQPLAAFVITRNAPYGI